MKALIGAFNQEKALVGAFSVIVQPVVEPMEHYTALNINIVNTEYLHLNQIINQWDYYIIHYSRWQWHYER